MGSARWGVFDHENWSVALDTSYFFFPSDFQKPTQRFKANECVTPFEKDPPAQPKILQTPGFGTFCVSCGICFFFYSTGVKNENNASLHFVAPFSLKQLRS